MNNKIKKYIILSVLVLAMLVLPTHFALAGVGGEIAGFLAWVLLWVGWVLGKIMTLLNDVLYELFAFQDFTNDGVNMGWAAARDVANMFFILVLLVISFATILRRENYSMKRYLPKLLFMAVAINYSKAITLFAIDFSQVIMLTFASSFTGVKSSFVTMLQLDKLTEVNKLGNGIDFDDAQILYGVALYVLFIFIAVFIFIMLIGILIMRMVMFWVLIVLSPLAFIAYTVPGGAGYFSKWMGELTKYLIVGPVLAFFTWLSMIAIQAATFMFQDIDVKDIVGAKAAIMKMGETDNIFAFITAIGMLVGTMKITQSIGAAGGTFGANMATNFKNKGVNFGKKAGKAVGVTGALGLGLAGGGTVAGAVGLGLGGAALAVGGAKLAKFGAKVGIRGGADMIGRGLQDPNRQGGFRNAIGSWITDATESSYSKQAKNTNKTMGKVGMGQSTLRNIRRTIQGRVVNPSVFDAATREHYSDRVRAGVDPATGQAHRDHDDAREQSTLNGGLRNFLLRNLHRATDPGHAGRARRASQLAAALAAGGVAQQPAQPATPAAPGVNPFELDRGKFEATKEWHSKGRRQAEFNPEKHYYDETFDVAKTTYEPDEKQNDLINKERSASFNQFSRGDSNDIAIDMSKLNVPELKTKGKNWNEVLGAHIDGKMAPGLMQKVAKSLVGAIDKELASSKGKRRENLENAKNRLSNPEELGHINLLNNQSPAWRASHKAAVFGTAHERAHEETPDELEADEIAISAIRSKKYSEIAKKSKVEEVLENENEKDDKKEVEVVKEVINQTVKLEDSPNDYSKSANFNMIFHLKRVAKGLESLVNSGNKTAKAISNLSSLSTDGDSLTVNVIKEEINKKINS